jgi:NAD+ kinase
MKFGVFANIHKQQVLDMLPDFFNWLGERVDLVISNRLYDQVHPLQVKANVVEVTKLPDESDLIVALGGDGTILTAARLVGRYEKPLIGVNLGGVGFLTEIPVEDLYPGMERIIEGDYRIEKRMVLCVHVKGQSGKQDYFALNDVVLDRGASPRVLRVDVTINDEYFNTYVADGIIVSTPTGSTAYSMASWGPIVVPSLESIILNSICPHALTVRPTVISASSKIYIQVHLSDSEAMLSVDGQEVVRIAPETGLEMYKGDFYVHLITFEENSFFDRLRKKLQWGSLPRK